MVNRGGTPHNARMRWRKRLRRAFWGLLLTSGLGAGVVAYLTRPSVLAGELRRVVLDAGFDDFRVGSTLWTPWDGLRASDVCFSRGRAVDGRAPRWKVEVCVPDLRVGLRWGDLLRGKVRPAVVVARRPEITVVHIPDGAPAPTDAQVVRGPEWPVALDMPEISALGANLALRVERSDGTVFLRRWIADLSGRAQDAGKYFALLRQVGGTAPGAAPPSEFGSLVELVLDSRSMTASTGWMDAEMFTALLPREAASEIASLGITGAVRLMRLKADASGIDELAVGLAGVSLTAPIEDYAESPAPKERFLRLNQSEAELLLHRTDEGYALSAALTGRLNDSDISARVEHGLLRGPALLGDPARTGELLRQGAWSLGEMRTRFVVRGFDLPTAERDPAWLASPTLPGPLRAFFKDYQPRGRVNLDVTLTRVPAREGVAGDTLVEGALEPQGASCRYFNFPYDVTDVYGRVRFAADGVYFDGLHGRHGGATIRGDGHLTNTSQWTGFDLTFNTRGMALDTDLYDALPKRYQRLLDTTQPIGLCDATAHMTRGDGSRELGYRPLDVDVRGRLVCASLSLSNEIRLEMADGLVSVGDQNVELRDLHGYPQSGGALALNGEISTGDDGGYEVGVLASAIRLRQVRVASPTEQPQGPELEFEGEGDLWGWARDGEAGDQSRFTVHVTDGALRFGDSDSGWQSVEGWLTLAPEARKALQFTAKRPGAALRGAGSLPANAAAGTELDLEAGLDAIEQLLGMLPKDRRGKLFEQLGVSGRGRVAVRSKMPGEAAGSGGEETTGIRIEAERMAPPALPLPLHDLKADIRTRGRDFTLEDLVVGHGANGRIEARGGGHGDEAGAEFGGSLTAANIELNEEFARALPKALRALFERLKITATADLTLDHLRIENAENMTAEFAGSLTLSGASLDVGLPLADTFGELAGGCTIDAAGTTLSAELAIEKGVLDGRAIRDWRARLLIVPEDSRIRIEDLRGRLCGGQITGSITIDADTGAYELNGNLANVGLVELMQLDGAAATKMKGATLDGAVFLASDGGRGSERRGGGELRIRAASLLGSRVTKSVYENVQARRPGATDEVDEALLRFTLEGSELRCDRLEIRTRDARFLGTGVLDMRSSAVNASLVSIGPEDAPRLLLLTDVLEWAGGELLQFEVSGTLEQPHVRAVALRRLTEPLRRLLRGE